MVSFYLLAKVIACFENLAVSYFLSRNWIWPSSLVTKMLSFKPKAYGSEFSDPKAKGHHYLPMRSSALGD